MSDSATRHIARFRLRLFLTGAIATTLALGGCGGSGMLRSPEVFTGSMPSVGAVIDSLEARRDTFHSLRALAKLTYWSPQGKQSARHVIAVQRPDRLRFEVLSVLGSMFVLTASNGSLTAYMPRESTVYRGRASRQNLAHYTRVDLTVAGAIDLFLGTPPLSRDEATDLSIDSGLLRLVQQRDDQVQTAWFAAGLDLIRYEHRDRRGIMLLRATFAKYEAVGGIRLATHLNLELAGGDERIEIALRDPEVNPQLSEAVFAQETPRGSREVDLDRVL